MTVREIVSLLKDAKKIKIGYEGTVYHFNQNDSVTMTAFGKFVVDGVYAIAEDVFEIDIAMRPVIAE